MAPLAVYHVFIAECMFFVLTYFSYMVTSLELSMLILEYMRCDCAISPNIQYNCYSAIYI